MKLKSLLLAAVVAVVLVAALAPAASAGKTGVSIKLKGPSHVAADATLKLTATIKDSLKYGGGDRVAVLGVKECFGEMALLDQSARSASVRAIKDVELLAISRDDFQDLLDLHPALARGIIRVLTQRLRVATEAVSADHNR